MNHDFNKIFKMNKINNMSIYQCADVPMQKPRCRHCGWAVRLTSAPFSNRRSLSGGAAVSEWSRRHPQSPANNIAVGVGFKPTPTKWNDGGALIPTLVRICNIFLLLFRFSLSISFGQEQELDKEIVKANEIKAIKKYSYAINGGKVKSNGLIKHQLFDKNGNLIEIYDKYLTTPKIKYEYDSAGNLIEKVNYNPNGSKNEIYTWEYDNNGRILKYVTYFSWSKTYYTGNYIYNKQGQNIEIYDIDKQGEKERITTMKYYDSGELFEKRFENKGFVRIERFDKCGNLIYKSEDGRERKIDTIKYIDSCKIDFSDKILKIDTVHYIENGKELTKITELWIGNKRNVKTIDNNGNKIIFEVYEYYEDNTLRHSNILFFNEQCQLIEKKTFYSVKEYSYDYHGNIPPNAPDTKYHFKYEYYDNGLEKIINYFNEKGVKTGYKEYVIEYY